MGLAAILVTILIGVLAGGAVIYFGLKRRTGAATPRRPSVDPFAVGEPWRRHVAAAISAQRRFAGMIGTLAEGPMRTRMVEIARQVDHGIDECWTIARRGDQLDGVIRSLAGSSLQSRLERATNPVEQESLRSQIAALDRIRATRDDTDRQLRVLQTRLGELVSQSAELATGASDTEQLGNAVDEVVLQLEALRLAVDDIGSVGRSGRPGLQEPGGQSSPST